MPTEKTSDDPKMRLSVQVRDQVKIIQIYVYLKYMEMASNPTTGVLNIIQFLRQWRCNSFAKDFNVCPQLPSGYDLGLDFLKKNAAVISFQNNTLQLSHNQHISAVELHSTSSKTYTHC